VTPGERKLLRIYLDDHQGVLLAGRELVRRMAKRRSDGELETFLTELLPELEDDRRRVISRLRAAGGSPSAVKSGLAWLAEKAGRLKPNGSLTKPTPLGPLLELEGLRAVLDASRSLWRTLERTDSSTADYTERAERAERRLAQVEELRLVVADVALGRRDVN
jgi:hypothetical protein